MNKTLKFMYPTIISLLIVSVFFLISQQTSNFPTVEESQICFSDLIENGNIPEELIINPKTNIDNFLKDKIKLQEGAING